jgi:hypothetical protein
MIVPASAQYGIYPNRLRPGAENTIQSSLSLTVALDEEEDMAAQQEDALRSLYKLAGGSCALVLETIADKCEIKNMTTNVRSDDTGQRVRRLTVTAQVMTQVDFKDLSEPAKP